MSSTTGLSRTRSVRRPPTNGTETPQGKPTGRSEARNVSPSRLPMRPPTTTTTSTTAPRTRPPSGTTSRQVSGGSTTTTTTTKAAASRLSGSSNGASAAPKPVLGRAQSVRQAPSTTSRPPVTTIGRSATTTTRPTTRPRSSEGTSSTIAPRERHMGHARAKSTVTSLTAATTLRPLPRKNPSPAPSSASSTSTGTGTTTRTVSATSSRAPARTQTQHARIPSQSQSQPQSQAKSQTQAQAQAQAKPQPTAPPSLAARRPAFNNNQQHYSPAKSHASKPLTATYLAPPSPSKQPVNVAITAETSRLQTELLQLSLLHREAHGVCASWHASAKTKLGARFEQLAAADQDLRALEREGTEARGIRDLIRWGESPAAGSPDEGEDGGIRRRRSTRRRKTDSEAQRILPLDEKIQLLDQVLNGVWALGEPGGRYMRTVRAFEEWAVHVAEIRAAQQGGDIDGLLARGGGGGFGMSVAEGGAKGEDEEEEEEEELGIFVSDLDASTWKRDHAGLVRILEGWRRTLAQLGDVAPDENGASNNTDIGDNGTHKPLSGLARTLRGCRSLVRDMLAELTIMEEMEHDALTVEEDWMEQMEARLKAEEEDEKRRGSSRRRKADDVPPWKLLVLQ
ncbi:hypothetical protein F4808DRAFT_159666 [Astrocystis sublimbata]|nr:hypothetical protein F4808DRAFT_159666 [Astrocystis sublimbata]